MLKGKLILFVCVYLLSQAAWSVPTPSNSTKDSLEVLRLLSLAADTTDEDYLQAYKFAKDARKIADKINFLMGVYKSEIYFGNYAYYTGKYQEAIEHYVLALRGCDQDNNNIGSADLYNNIGSVYYAQNNYNRALPYFQKALFVYKRMKNYDGLGKVLNNIGNIYFNKEEYDQALTFYKKALLYKQKIKDLSGEGLVLNNIGNIYGSKGEYTLSLNYFLKALAIKEKTKDRYGTGLAHFNIGYLYTLTKDLAKAQYHTQKCIEIAEEIKSPDLKKDAYSSMAGILFASGKYKEAYEYFTEYDLVKDSLINETTQKNIKEIEEKYNSEKKDAIHKAELERLKILREKDEAERQRKDLFIFGLIGVVSLVVVLLLVLIRSNRNKQKSNLLLNEQKRLIESKNDELSAKNKNITDSITYAKFLQEAILPPIQEIKQHLPNSFILYLPKDIVAGDFYFFEVVESNDGIKKIFIAAADSTGHGVPGAMVSVVCSNALNRSVKEFGLSDPGEILDKTRELVLETFAKSQKNVRDGMDISLLVIEMKQNVKSETCLPLYGQHESKQVGSQQSERVENNSNSEPLLSLIPDSYRDCVLRLKWAGANNPLWYSKNGEMKEIQPDKQPIGYTTNPKPFTTHELPLSLSTLFLFTDGYADQFGGEKGKKMGYKRFKTILTELKDNMQAGKEISEKEFQKWATDHEQVDDVCLIGIKL